MKEFKNFNDLTVELLKQELENYEDETITACEIAWTLTQGYNIDGTITYNTKESINLINKYWYDIADIYNDVIFNNGNCEINMFNEPELFLTAMFIENAEYLLSRCKIIDNNWNENIELNRENINTIKKQLESEVME